MNFFSNVMNFLMFMFLMRILFIIASALRPKGEIMPSEQAPKSPLLQAVEESREFEAVTDENCGVLVPKHEAYIVVKDDGPHYFCSWECRQEFIEKNKSQG